MFQAASLLSEEDDSPDNEDLPGQLPRSVCFVSETGRHDRPLLDGSVRYRCFHLAQELKRFGVFTSVCAARQFYEAPHDDYDLYVFHRPNASRLNFERSQSLLRKAKRQVIADYDDLIFGDAEIALQSSAAKNGTLDVETLISAFEANLRGLRHFDVVTASTTPLAEMAQHFHAGAQTHVVPNCLPAAFVELHRELGTPWRQRPSTRLGYFAGTKSHDRDLPIVQEVLHRLLSENPHYQLLIVGPVAVPPGLAALPNVLVSDVVDYPHLPRLMSICSTVIAPLEESQFNSCKSRVKFLEAAVSGCHLVASPIPDMAALQGQGISLAITADDWYNALSFPLQGEALAQSRQLALSSLNSMNSVAAFLGAVRAAK